MLFRSDGIVQGLEQCDDGDENSDLDPDACRNNCRLPICGDSVEDTGEACDDQEKRKTHRKQLIRHCKHRFYLG